MAFKNVGLTVGTDKQENVVVTLPPVKPNGPVSVGRMKEVLSGKRVDQHALDYRQTAARKTRVWNRAEQRFDSITSQDGLERDRTPEVAEPEKWYGIVGNEFVVAESRPKSATERYVHRATMKGMAEAAVNRKTVTVEQRQPVAPTATRKEIVGRAVRAGKPREDGFLRCGRCGARLPDSGDYIAVKWGYFCSDEHAEQACPFAKVVGREAKA